MRRRILIPVLAGVFLVGAAVLWQTVSFGQNPGKGNGNKQAENPVPIRQVVLFNSGVSYFQREGEVEGNTHVDLSFPTSNVNDLLKSLILQDLGGGRISTVNYDSHDPIDKILRSFALDLNNNPSFGQILNQARGEKIEILRQEKKDGQPTKQVGTIVGMEVQKKHVGKDAVQDVDLLNLSGDTGLQSIPLEQVVSVRFINPVLEHEFQRALKVLASSHDTQKKTVSLGFNGQGRRAVRVGYVVEHPIWKTSYRLRVEPNGKVFIQGWAIVENTSDDDWNDVRMVLVSGRPISFKMNLYEPLYIPRPDVEPELFASLRPPVYGGAMEFAGKDGKADAAGRAQVPASPPPGMTQFAPGNFGGFPGMGGMGGMGGGPPPGGGYGFNQNWGAMPNNYMQNLGQNRYQNSNRDEQQGQQQQLFNYQNKLTFEELQKRQQEVAQRKGEAKRAGAAIAALNFKEGIASVASAEELGDYYQYVLDQKISLPRQKSAMLPILDQTIDGTKVSIFNESTHAKFPLLGLRLKNSSGQPLNQGPITVYEEGSYAGDTRILDLHPNDERLLSFALDQTTEVKHETKSTPSPDMHFKIGEANLTANYKVRETRTYTLKNRAAKDRTVILEHPIRPNWKLVDPQKPQEKTRDLYRFQVTVPAGQSMNFDVVEEMAKVDQLALQGGQPQYVAGSGIQIKALTHVEEEKLLALKIQKGFLLPTHKARESRSYFIQNFSDIAREFTIDHIIRADWVRLNDQGDPQRGPEVFRFVLKVPQSKTASKEIIEERTHQEKGKLVKDLPEVKLREYVTSPVPSAEVKAALTKVLAMNTKLAETAKNLAEQEKQLKQVSDDQERLRKNLSIIPQSAEPYKRFLDKFVSQETEIEGFQKQIRQLQESVSQQQRELDTFIAALNAE